MGLNLLCLLRLNSFCECLSLKIGLYNVKVTTENEIEISKILINS